MELTDKGSVIHEICHTLGMVHEHQRWDRNKHVKIHYDNIVNEKEESNFDRRLCYFTTEEFDFNSIMLYPSRTSSTTVAIDITKPIISRVDGSEDGSSYLTNTSDLSSGDIQLINSMYSDACIVSPPIVVTEIFLNTIKKTQAIVGGRVTFNGNAYVTDCGIIFRKSLDPESSNIKIQIDEGNGSFSTLLSDLTPNTIYSVRAYATNSAGIDYGNNIEFTTCEAGNADIIFNPDLVYGSVCDIDGNKYKTVKIGTQTWMAENLRTTKYRNGDAITNPTASQMWGMSSGAYVNYNNDTSYVTTYGRMYNWHAVDDSRCLAPTGWHVPSQAEWNTLTAYLGGVYIAGGKLKETGTKHWSNPNEGATNESGFTALPGGRCQTGVFEFIGNTGYYWLANATYVGTGSYASLFELESVNGIASYIDGISAITYTGYSVRCIKDN